MPKRDEKLKDVEEAEELILLGRISGAHGIKGEVKINSFTEPPENIATYGALVDGKGGRFVIESCRPLKNIAVAARIAGVSDRNAAEALKGVELYIERARLPEPDEDEWYYEDLIGLTAVFDDGASVGTVVAVQNYGAGDLLEIRPGDKSQTLLVPFTREAVPEVDIRGGRVVIAAATEIEDERGPE